MTSYPRIFIGTLASGETEFDECCQAVQSQKDVVIKHHIIKNMPEFEAHNALWAAWNEQKQNHDLFAKIDADTVLNRDTALVEISKLFQDPDVTGAQIPLHDYFTDDLINGLNCFSTCVQFAPAKKKIFADHADSNHKKVLKSDDVAHLAPIGWHGKNPSAKQAFHFGFHRALKGQKDIISKTLNAWKKYQDTPREWALAGAASAKWWMFGRADYTGFFFNKYFEKMKNDSVRKNTVNSFVNRFERAMS